MKHKQMKVVTRESLQKMLDDPRPEFVRAVVAKALVSIYANQTDDEKYCEETVEYNGVGFTAFDGKVGSFHAKQAMKNRTVSDKALSVWLKKNSRGISRIAKYHGQLNEIAKRKQLKSISQ